MARRPHGWHDGTQPLTEAEWSELVRLAESGALEHQDHDA